MGNKFFFFKESQTFIKKTINIYIIYKNKYL